MSTTGASQDAGTSLGKARSKSTVYRVTGLPCLPSEEEVASFLRKAVEQELQDEEQLDEGGLSVKMKNIKKISIILPPDGSTNSAVALVDWKPGNYPNFISTINKDPSKSWEIDFKQSQISFDRHFLGFTQLYTTKAEKKISADIIALTGLDGHAYGSFRGKGNLGKMWLRDFLPEDLPNCRTMIYGYNSKLLVRGIDRIMDYGYGLLQEIQDVRNSKEARQRPLIFIAHSFGGIILAHSIVQTVIGSQQNSDMAALYKSTYGILFFGTPHKGLIVSNIKQMLSKDGTHPRHGLLEEIDINSGRLLSQLPNFKNIIDDRKIVSFYEQRQTQELVEVRAEISNWSRKGKYSTAVDPESSVLWLPDNMEAKIPLDSDHSSMVKFENKHERGYKMAKKYLQEFEKHAPAVVAARFSSKQVLLQPSSTVPYDKDPHFVGRVDTLQKVERKLSLNTSHARLALVGLGGIGKSQIAIEFSHRLREKSKDKWVFWVYANTIARFQQSYRDIANSLKLDGRDDSKVDILQLVSEWLKDERNGRWVLIIDNADDAWMFSPPGTQAAAKETAKRAEITASGDYEAGSAKNLLAYIPASRNGAVLVTSRNKDAAHRIVGNHVDNLIEINQMANSEALHLLKVKLPDNQCLDGSLDLLAELDNIPLAITQAAAYITRGSPRMNISKYLALFQKNDEHRTSLLDQDAGDLRRDSEVPNAIIRTWQISFDQIERENQPAADLLSLMSVLNRQGIPESLLREEMDDELGLENSLKMLLGFSLITSEIGGELFDMHRLVQLATRKWLKSQNTLERFNQNALYLLSSAFPEGKYENWKQCALLLPHVDAILECNFEGEDNLLQKARLLYNFSSFLNQQGEYQLAKLNIEETIRIQERYLGEKDLDLGASYNLYGLILKNLGRYEDAEIMLRKYLKISKEVNGERHRETLTSMNNIGNVLERQGKYEEAESLHRQALRFRTEELDERHPDTLTSMNNIGAVLEKQGKYEEAESLHRQALRFRIEELDERHPDTLISMNDLGLVLQSQGKYEEAEVTYRDLISLQEVVFSSEHPEHLTTLNNLALLLEKMKKYDDASVYYQKACRGYYKVLKNEHPYTKETLNDYADMIRSMDDTEENKLLYQKEVLRLYDEIFGPEHPQTLQNLALNLGGKKGYTEASELFRKALLGFQKALGNKHSDTRNCLRRYGNMVWEIDDANNAIPYDRQVLQLYEEIFGLDDPKTLVAVHNLAYDLGELGEYVEASELFQRAYLARLKVLGSEDSKTINTKECYSAMFDEITDPETKRIVQRQYDEAMNGNTFVSRLHKNYWMFFHVSDGLGCVIVGLVFCQMLAQHSGSVRRRFLSQR